MCGMSAIAIDDAREDAVYLARDRIGVKPLYVADDGDRVLFGSEIKAFWPVRERSAFSTDTEALHHYLAFNYIPALWTIYEGVRHVMPGTWMKFSRKADVQVRLWWSLVDQREKGRSHDEPAFALQAAQHFGCEQPGEVAELSMLERCPQVLHQLDQPHCHALFMPTLRVSELAVRHVKVALTGDGDGGDELFAGYDKCAQYFARPGVQSLFPHEFQRSYFDLISLSSPEAKLALYLDMQLLLSGSNLVKLDRMGMAVSIEAHTPFPDWQMMEFAFRSRGDAELAGAHTKHWCKKAVVPLIGEALAALALWDKTP